MDGTERVQGAGSGTPASPAARSHLVVGFDGSSASLAALGTAAQLGELLAAELHVVHAVDLRDYPVDPDADDWEDWAAGSVEEERQRVSSALAGYGGPWSFLAVRADPAEALEAVAQRVGALMIVVGATSHGWRHLADRLSGISVSHRLVDRCRSPILVVGHHRPV